MNVLKSEMGMERGTIRKKNVASQPKRMYFISIWIGRALEMPVALKKEMPFRRDRSVAIKYAVFSWF